MKTITKFIGIAGLLAATIPLISACEKEIVLTGVGDQSPGSVMDVSSDGTSTIDPSALQLVFVETSGLSQDEMKLLVELKEEEKLAHDVYYALSEKWGSNVFSNISDAEETHMNSVIRLLKYYGSSDTLIANAGVFFDPKFQDLYETLVVKGSESIEDAMGIGALIEDMDIYDISEILDQTDNTNIAMVLENLEKGSRNHMRSFYKQLTKLGITYSPEYIFQSEYDQIVSSSIESGNQNGSNQNLNKQENGQGNGNQNRFGNR